MPLANVFLETLEHDVDDLRRRLAILHRTLDRTTYWPPRLRLRRQIEQTQCDLVAARRRRRAHIHRDPP